MYELRYIYGLEPVEKSEALKRGSGYHEYVDNILRLSAHGLMSDSTVADLCSDASPKIYAMVCAFVEYILPELKKLPAWSFAETKTEQWFNYETPSGHGVIGRWDAIMGDGTVIEHKTTSALDAAYLERLEFDEQINTYLLSAGNRELIYTVCCTPSIRQRGGESDTDFFIRCWNWYGVDTERKVAVLHIRRTETELREFASVQDRTITEMENCSLFYRNPNHCMKWGRLCEFAPICKNYDPKQEYIQFKKREGENYEVPEA